MPAQRHSTGTPFEARVGFSRAVRVGNRILVSGTLGLTPDNRPAGDAYEQSVAAIRRIVGAIEALGGQASDVVRTRMFATDPVGDFDAIARAHTDAFGANPPVTSLLGTSALVVEGCVIEIEAEAELGAGAP